MTLTLEGAIAANAGRVRARVESACERASRPASSVTLIAVSKAQPAEAIVAAMSAGITDFGENYAQEAAAKMDLLAALVPALPSLHFIGHIQTNKARLISGRFVALHGIDSPKLLRAVAEAATVQQEIFIQVSLSDEASKGGIAPEGLETLVREALAEPRVRLLGLMTIPPGGPAEASRAPFRRLQALAAEYGLNGLSMGMTNDFEVAIEEGATHIRVGRAIFGERSG